MARHVVIIGNGVAGFSAARRLRREDHDLTISLFSDEAYPFYMRSRLKDFICGAASENEVILESRNLYRREGLNLFLKSPVVGLDVEHREVLLGGGDRIHYDQLLIATGSSPAPLALPGAELQGIFTFSKLADAEAIRKWMTAGRKAVVVGRGIVSMQLAEGLARLGADVEYLLLTEQFWPNVLDAAASRLVEELLLGNGVRIRKQCQVTRIVGTGDFVSGVELSGGETVRCDMLGHGSSFTANTRILEGTPVVCRGGVLVNDLMETNVEGVYAAGDCISCGPNEDEPLLRHPRWQNAFRQGEIAALNILGRRQPIKSFATSIRTELFGLGIAALGRSNLPADHPGLSVVEQRRGEEFHRLVFVDEMFVGAILMGNLEPAAALEDYLLRGATLADLENELLPALTGSQSQLKEPLVSHCPICTNQMVLPAGSLVGHVFRCASCSAQLRMIYGDDGLELAPA